ncbi:YigZ family protein [Actinacidiphila bryophytorum]|uniref:IMPACT family member YvyE n=1 Tax=Actinacidiphila bryophytorum TaxID=1436133 RepID=A0A9W4H8P3_9ACTN|nr:YigZ family protein [Actinacidiphila bryophytorum]MBM9438353.1 YigZ family protein [Actinacidiphila bryophytorum]MBN6545211.1 YigZ family protein [Actinacidiphila bryophytorum]CAG7658125.1 IMPACT family member YvyE [Actinacidiphila bryophytorum]
MADRYLTVARTGVHESEIKRSRFLCTLAPAADEEAAQAVIRAVRRGHPAATHNCFAYVIGPDVRLHRASDDGEPGGTAGTPMLQVLLGREVRDTVAVVTRYYGGIQLGAGGLARAYGGAVSAALDEIGTVERRRLALLTVTVDHARAGRLENDLRSAGHVLREVRYGADVTLALGVPEGEVAAFTSWLADVTSGAARCEAAGSAYVDM